MQNGVSIVNTVMMLSIEIPYDSHDSVILFFQESNSQLMRDISHSRQHTAVMTQFKYSLPDEWIEICGSYLSGLLRNLH